MKNRFNKAKLALVAFGSMAATGAAHAVDTVAVGTAITAAEADALTTGEMVIGAVAGLVVIGLIIGIVKKI